MKTKLIVAVTILTALVVAMWVDPIPQDLSYHLFADTLSRWGIAHFLNVASNFPFVLVGLMGLWSLQLNHLQINSESRVYYWVFFIGVVFVGLGSSWYHLNPNNQTLVWDRLPMTVAFMAVFSVILAEHVNAALGKRLLWPLIVIGLISIVYWHHTESIGAGDLRWYALIQFVPLIMIPLIFVVYPKRYSHGYLLWMFLGMYVLAKLLEHFDHQIFQTLIYISGHSLKHLAAVLGIYFYWRYLRVRVTV